LDGAYNTGIREADRIASRPWNVGRGVNQTSNWANPHAFASGWMDRDYFQEKGGGADVDPLHRAGGMEGAVGSQVVLTPTVPAVRAAAGHRAVDSRKRQPLNENAPRIHRAWQTKYILYTY